MTALKPLHNLVVAQMTLLMRDIETRMVSSPGNARQMCPQVHPHSVAGCTVREATLHQEAQHVEEFDKSLRGVVETNATIETPVTVTVKETIKQPLEIKRIRAHVLRG